MAKINCILISTAIDRYDQKKLKEAIKTLRDSHVLKTLELEQISREILENRIPAKVIAKNVIAVLSAAKVLNDVLEIKII